MADGRGGPPGAKTGQTGAAAAARRAPSIRYTTTVVTARLVQVELQFVRSVEF